MKQNKKLRFTKNKRTRAVSPVIATIILIAATMVIALAAWAWASSASASSQHNLGQAAQTDIHAISERFQILTTNFTYSAGQTTTSTISVWILNSGIYDTNISYIIINSTTYSTNGGWSLPKGQLTEITITNLSPQVKQGDLQIIKAVGQYGSYFAYQVVA